MKKVINYILKTIMWSVVGIIGLLVLAVVLLYLPPVQNLVVKKALESVNKSGDMHISVKKLRLGFPSTSPSTH